jgi:5-methylcytosine-specific restriction endonuclease McrA
MSTPRWRCCADCAAPFVQTGSERRCLKHQALYAARRRGHRQQMDSPEWRRLSALVLANQPVCQNCKTRPSKEVHHPLARSRGNPLLVPPGQLVALCHGCHTAETNKERGQMPPGIGWLVG